MCPYLEVPHLPSDYGEQNNCLEDRPPLDTLIGRLCGIPVCTFANNNVLLLVLHCGKAVRQRADLAFNGRDNVYGAIRLLRFKASNSGYLPSSST